MSKERLQPLVLAVITARGGSKGLPGKNIKVLGDRPLIVYTIEVAKKSRLITDLIVSTDGEDIARICREYGAEVPFMEPAELASDSASIIDVMRYAIEFRENQKKCRYDYVVILQPTSPFRLPKDIDDTLQLLIEMGADSAVSLVEIEKREHPMKVKKLVDSKVEPYCIPEPEATKRQDLPVAYKRSGAVYAMKRDLIMKEGLLYGKNIVGHLIPQDRSIDIDTPFDWLRAIYMLEDLKNKGYHW